MNAVSCFIVAFGLSMDNLAVCIASGCCSGGKLRFGKMLFACLCFTAAHILMFCAGWFGGRELGRWAEAFGHWIAFLGLVLIGIKMVKEALHKKQTALVCRSLSVQTLFVLALATSLDALLVAMALSLTAAPFLKTLLFMAVCVFATGMVGFYLGRFLGRRFGTIMEVLGGVALAAIGVRVLLNGLGIC